MLLPARLWQKILPQCCCRQHCGAAILKFCTGGAARFESFSYRVVGKQRHTIIFFAKYEHYSYGRPQKFFQRGQNHQHLVDRFFGAPTKNRPFSGAPIAQSKISAVLRRFRLNLWVNIASAEGGSEILGYFVGEQHMTSSFLNSSPANIRTCELWVWTVVPCFIPHYGGISLYRRA